MSNELSDQDQTNLALASLIAALVQALGEQDKELPQRFCRNLEALYDDLKSFPTHPYQTMATIRHARDIVSKG